MKRGLSFNVYVFFGVYRVVETWLLVNLGFETLDWEPVRLSDVLFGAVGVVPFILTEGFPVEGVLAECLSALRWPLELALTEVMALVSIKVTEESLSVTEEVDVDGRGSASIEELMEST